MTLLKSTGETLARICKQKIDAMKDNEDLLKQWTNDMCENRCGENGHCYKGHCKCKDGKVKFRCTK